MIPISIFLSLSMTRDNTLNSLGDYFHIIPKLTTEMRLKFIAANETEFLIICAQNQRDKFQYIFPTPIYCRNISPITSMWNVEVN